MKEKLAESNKIVWYKNWNKSEKNKVMAYMIDISSFFFCWIYV